jgi:hypothetical protein
VVRRHAFRIVLSAFASLLVVPVAVNIGTGGNAPAWLKPFVNWLWPIAIVCVVLVIALELWDKRESRGSISTRRPNDPRNIQLALAQVARYVEARQRGSLAEQVRIALALDERPESVRQPAHLVQRVSGDEFQLSADLTIADVFVQMNESMLVLGAPGAGKTTQLLDLAQALIVQARSASDPAVPVVLDLADWIVARRRGVLHLAPDGDDRAAFGAWLVASLAERFRIPPDIGRLWMTENRLTLLLDGLDEVPETDREQCVTEINAMQYRYGVTRVAVCSREADYARLTNQLRLQGAVVIRPLARDTVKDYLASVSPAQLGVLSALEADEELWELLTTPLMLTIMMLARVDQSSQALTETAEPTGRRRLLFDAYVVEVLARRRSNELGEPERILRAIRTLAAAAAKLETGVLTPPLDPDKANRWLPEPAKGVARLWIGPVAIMAAATAWTVASASRFGAVAGIVPVLLGLLFLLPMAPAAQARIVNRWAFAGIVLAVAAVPAALAVTVLALFAGPRWLLTAAGVAAALLTMLSVVVSGMWETPIRSKSSPRDQFYFTLIGLVAAGGVLLCAVRPRLIEGWALGIALGTCLFVSVLFDPAPMAETVTAPAGIHRVRRAQRYGYVAVGVLLVLVFADRWPGPFVEPVAGFVVGLIYGFFAGFLLFEWLGTRLFKAAMVIAGEPVPWRRSFLRFATDRSLLTRTGGEYRFIHLLVRDHLATCDPVRLAGAVRQRRTELLTPG